MYRGLLAAGAAVVVIACPIEARADALSEARKAVDGSDYPTAKTSLQAALQAGTASPAELAEIYKLTGIVEGALNNAQGATTAFAKWLSLDPKASLPAGTSPKFMRPFEAAQQQAVKRGQVEAKAETQDEPPAVTLVIANDPHKLIAGARVYFRVDKRAEQALGGDVEDGKVTIQLETGKRIDLRIHAVDQYGNHVVELGTKDVPLVITSSGTTKVILDPTKPDVKKPAAVAEPAWYATWWVWGIATGVSAGITGFFGWRTKVAIDDLDTLNANSYVHRWSEAQDVETRAERNVLLTNIGLGLTGALAIGTVVFYFVRPSADDTESEPRAAITPIPGGGAVVLGGTF